MRAPNVHPTLKSETGRAIAMLLRSQGFPVHRISALFDVNQGRIAEAIGDRRSEDQEDQQS